MRFKLILPLILLTSYLQAQLTNDMEDESKLYAESKQVNQFFRRFNGEEDEKGKRIYPGDKQYRNAKLRKKYLSILFDGSNGGMTEPLKAEFTKNVLDKSETSVVDFHAGNWFSEVQATFAFN